MRGTCAHLVKCHTDLKSYLLFQDKIEDHF